MVITISNIRYKQIIPEKEKATTIYSHALALIYGEEYLKKSYAIYTYKYKGFEYLLDRYLNLHPH